MPAARRRATTSSGDNHRPDAGSDGSGAARRATARAAFRSTPGGTTDVGDSAAASLFHAAYQAARPSANTASSTAPKTGTARAPRDGRSSPLPPAPMRTPTTGVPAASPA